MFHSEARHIQMKNWLPSWALHFSTRKQVSREPLSKVPPHTSLAGWLRSKTTNASLFPQRHMPNEPQTTSWESLLKPSNENNTSLDNSSVDFALRAFSISGGNFTGGWHFMKTFGDAKLQNRGEGSYLILSQRKCEKGISSTQSPPREWQ